MGGSTSLTHFYKELEILNTRTNSEEFQRLMGFRVTISATHPKGSGWLLPIMWKLLIRLHVARVFTDASEPEIHSRIRLKRFLKFNAFLTEVYPTVESNSTYRSVQLMCSNDANFFSGFCSICLDKPTDTVLTCQHAFCQGCLDSFFKRDHHCPACRMSVKNLEADSFVYINGNNFDV